MRLSAVKRLGNLIRMLRIRQRLRDIIRPSLNRLYFSKFGLMAESNIFTHLTSEEKITLHRLSREIGVNPIAVEIGSYLGSSSCFIANAIQRKMGYLYSIDTWANQTMPDGERDTYQEFKANTYRYRDVIKTLRGWSSEVVGEYAQLNKKIDLLFIDGDHSYEACKLDWESYSPFLNERAIVVFHDTGWAEGVNRVIEESVVKVADEILELHNMQAYRLKEKLSG